MDSARVQVQVDGATSLVVDRCGVMHAAPSSAERTMEALAEAMVALYRESSARDRFEEGRREGVVAALRMVRERLNPVLVSSWRQAVGRERLSSEEFGRLLLVAADLGECLASVEKELSS